MINGIAIKIICSGLFRITSPWNEKIIINVSSNPIVVTFPNLGMKLFSK
jgi:hypothetical protein